MKSKHKTVCRAHRATLFEHAQKNVHSLETLGQCLTDTHDVWNCPKCAIAARYDYPGTNKTGTCGKAVPYGAIDAKLTASHLIGTEGVATLMISGPAYGNWQGTPAFSWSEWSKYEHDDIPAHRGQYMQFLFQFRFYDIVMNNVKFSKLKF